MFEMRKMYPLIFILFLNSLCAQIEIGIMTGMTGYLGDLSPESNLKSQVDINELNPGAGFLRRIDLNRHFSFRANFLTGKISGNDQNSNDPGQQYRDLHFRARIYEASMQLEWNILNFMHGKDRDRVIGISSPYFFAGIGCFYFNPQAQVNQKWIDLQPLGTEGQHLKNSEKSIYNRVQLNIPFGFGFKYAVSENGSIGFELGIRKTFTDYLDDVSGEYPHIRRLERENPLAAQLSYKGNSEYNPIGQNRGDATKKDWYFFAGLMVMTNLKKSKSISLKKKRSKRHRYR